MSSQNDTQPNRDDDGNAGSQALRRVRRVRIEEHQERVIEHLRGSLKYKDDDEGSRDPGRSKRPVQPAGHARRSVACTACITRILTVAANIRHANALRAGRRICPLRTSERRRRASSRATTRATAPGGRGALLPTDTPGRDRTQPEACLLLDPKHPPGSSQEPRKDDQLFGVLASVGKVRDEARRLRLERSAIAA